MSEPLDDRLIGWVRDATLEVFSTMLGVEVAVGEPRVEESAPPAHGVMALVGLAGAWVGTGCFSCNGELACRLSSAMLMSEFPAVNEEVLDTVGEITNMVLGNVKSALEEQVGPMGLSIPSVIFGKNFITRTLGRTSWQVLPFTCEGQTFEVSICVAPNDPPLPPHHGFSRPCQVNV